MSTIKSSAENLTLNADGANNDVIIQSNGSTKVTVDGATGAVGIGRTPSISSSKLEVGGADDVSLINVEASGATGGIGIGGTGLQLYHGSTARMKIDSTGAVTMPAQPAFSVTAGGNDNLGLSTTTANFNSEIFDQNSDFNTSTYKFTAPVTGKYQFNMSFRLDQLDSAAGYYRLKFITSNRTYTSLIIDPNFTSDIDYYHMSGSYLADMDSGDTAEVAIQQNGGTSQTDLKSGADTHFSGYLVA